MTYRIKKNINRRQSRPRRKNKSIENRKKLKRIVGNNLNIKINILKPNSKISCPQGFHICGTESQECCPDNINK